MIVYLSSRKIGKTRAMRALTDRVVRKNPRVVIATVEPSGEIRLEKSVEVVTQKRLPPPAK